MRRTRSARLHGEAQNLALLPAATSSLLDAMELMPSGHGFQAVPIDPELTTRQVADLLNVFRPYLVKPLEEGGIPHAEPGVGAAAPTIFSLARRSAMKPGRRRRAIGSDGLQGGSYLSIDRGLSGAASRGCVSCFWSGGCKATSPTSDEIGPTHVFGETFDREQDVGCVVPAERPGRRPPQRKNQSFECAGSPLQRTPDRK